MKLSQLQKANIEAAMEYADQMDKSTEWAFQFAADKSHCDVDDVIDYLVSKSTSTQ